MDIFVACVICQKIRYGREKAVGEGAVVHGLHYLVVVDTEFIIEVIGNR